MKDVTPGLQALHTAYCQATGLALLFTFARLRAWELWSVNGWTAEDLRLVVRHLKTKIAADRKWPSALQFRNLIERTDLFEEELAEARAHARRPVTSERERVLQASGRPPRPPAPPAQSAGAVLDKAKAFAAFKAWRAQSGL